MKFWLYDTTELTKSSNVIPKRNMSNAEFYNTLSRLVILIIIGAYIIVRHQAVLFIGVGLIFLIFFRYKNIMEKMTNYANVADVVGMDKLQPNNLYNSDLVYSKLSNHYHDYELSDSINEINNPLNANINYYKNYNNRNNISNKKDFKRYDKYLNFLYPNRLVKYCKEGYLDNCFKVEQNYTPNTIHGQINN